MKKGLSLYLTISLTLCLNSKAQRIGNYAANGSFEEHYSCPSVPLLAVASFKNWTSIDSICPLTSGMSACNGIVPLNVATYQYAHSGDSYVGVEGYYLSSNPLHKRGYIKNRLKYVLQASKTYCVKFYINISNHSTIGIDGFGAYFGDGSIDTITTCNAVLSYIIPQVQNLQGNIITDTLKWVAITGTFTANGTEKYLLLGNFLSDDNTDTLLINPTNLPAIFTEVLIDDVSCIEVDLPAYAGRDTTIYLGDSAYIGREPDFAIDSGCVWYQLPNMTTAIDTISGMWVKPAITTTYIVRQELECSAVKWDTVIVMVRDFDVGIGEIKNEKIEVKIFPNPANNVITIESNNASEELFVVITDLTGRKLLSQHLILNSHAADMEVPLINGAYIITVSNNKDKTITKKLLIAK